MTGVNPIHLVVRQPDVIERTMMEVLGRGPILRLVRLVKNGPICPSMIAWLITRFEPGCPSNSMERSPHIAAYVSGEVFDGPPWRLFTSGKAGSSHITRAEYARLVAQIAANRRANRYDPRTTPFKAVDIGSMELPFPEVNR